MIIEAKETYYKDKRDLLYRGKRDLLQVSRSLRWHIRENIL
jgi:hypothetical protein